MVFVTLLVPGLRSFLKEKTLRKDNGLVTLVPDGGWARKKVVQPSPHAIPLTAKSSTTLTPPSSRLYREALAFFITEEYDHAIVAFLKVLKIQPYHVDALFGLGRAYLSKGEKEKAVNTAHKLADAAEALYSLGNKEEAFRSLSLANDILPEDDIFILYSSALIYEKCDNMEKASEKHYKIGVIFYKQALSTNSLRLLRRAMRAFLKAKELSPSFDLHERKEIDLEYLLEKWAIIQKLKEENLEEALALLNKMLLKYHAQSIDENESKGIILAEDDFSEKKDLTNSYLLSGTIFACLALRIYEGCKLDENHEFTALFNRSIRFFDKALEVNPSLSHEQFLLNEPTIHEWTDKKSVKFFTDFTFALKFLIDLGYRSFATYVLLAEAYNRQNTALYSIAKERLAEQYMIKGDIESLFAAADIFYSLEKDNELIDSMVKAANLSLLRGVDSTFDQRLFYYLSTILRQREKHEILEVKTDAEKEGKAEDDEIDAEALIYDTDITPTELGTFDDTTIVLGDGEEEEAQEAEDDLNPNPDGDSDYRAEELKNSGPEDEGFNPTSRNLRRQRDDL
ncbi:hypothetical protein A2230_01005 [candidate division WOR-1 bacterium RIFOXYA2_FULL_36_21]|uniref:Uncharacterized protein n=1 Tax=candidate division WOR-1 bacterium RIFOXYB2_FULL_36_35 TaxID=1802578 RepID=A0A1F4S4A2_UNCSA|nr:MAG: hypothetical protein A2230_01005 [candidate division WOR-1 bacterium RIFOXYA2_FULL_36_21]OGC14259.1 MAG: hypothetical protein A2282_06720 [candidate division WOR-1 bacterium RIFOXYA12_FULL_36_13]OGC15264.1 MAG: hypothetical protein A2290_03215 [candidate division WOR-1 bacterium RIFOXYB2_FULL_36_35]